MALTEDLPETINTFRYYSGWADKIFGQTIGTTHQKFAYTLRQPIGVVAQIIPWNYVRTGNIPEDDLRQMLIYRSLFPWPPGNSDPP